MGVNVDFFVVSESLLPFCRQVCNLDEAGTTPHVPAMLELEAPSWGCKVLRCLRPKQFPFVQRGACRSVFGATAEPP